MTGQADAVPAGHLLQPAEAFRPLAADQVPMGQVTHAAPASDHVPGSQGAHAAPPPVLEEPAGQLTHEFAPRTSENLPKGQELQAADPDTEKVPGSQALHATLPPELALPAAHVVQLAPRALLKRPAGQPKQAEPESEVVPGSQPTHGASPPVLDEPGAHITHDVAPANLLN